MKKINFITSNLAPYRAEWCEELSKYYDVKIIYTKDSDFERDDRWLVNRSDKCELIKLNNVFNNKRNPLCFDVIKYLNQKNTIYIFDGYGPVTNLIGMIYLGIKKNKFYVNVDGWQKGTKEPKINKLIKKCIFKIDFKFLCSSVNTKAYLKEYGVSDERMIVHNFSSIRESRIENKKDLFLAKKYAKEKLGIKGKNVIAVGRFIKLKRFEDLLYAKSKSQENYGLYIIGGMPTEEYLKIIDEYKLKDVHFVDLILDKRILDLYYLACDIFVLPTSTDVWGLVVNEAMAKGLPIISTTNCVSGFDLIEVGKNGYRIEVGDIESLSNYIDELINNDKKRIEFGYRSLEIIKNYTIENMVKIHKKEFDSCCKE